MSSTKIPLNPENPLVDMLVVFWQIGAVHNGVSQGRIVQAPALGNREG